MRRDTLEGRVALITGGAGGIGRGIAKVLSEKGVTVIIGDIREQALEEARRSLASDQGASVYSRTMDVRRIQSIEETLDWAQETFESVDLLVNNAGVCYEHSFLDENEAADRNTIEVNLRGVLNTTRAFATRLIARKRGGSVVNIASNAAKRPYSEYIEYNATKAAVVNLTHTLSQELAQFGINVNAVCPGAVDTDMLTYCMCAAIDRSHGAFTLEEARASWGPKQLGRLVQPEEVGRVVAFLLSSDAAIIRGQAINVDAGDTQF